MSRPDVERLTAEFSESVEEIRRLADSLRSDNASLLEQLHAERDALRQQRERGEDDYARSARDGDLGRARQELQERLDRNETTWRAVMAGTDTHWSAAQVRAEVVGDARETIDRLEQEDPEFSRQYREIATLRGDEAPGEWR
jgi:hypothetical protein